MYCLYEYCFCITILLRHVIVKPIKLLQRIDSCSNG